MCRISNGRRTRLPVSLRAKRATNDNDVVQEIDRVGNFNESVRYLMTSSLYRDQMNKPTTYFCYRQVCIAKKIRKVLLCNCLQISNKTNLFPFTDLRVTSGIISFDLTNQSLGGGCDSDWVSVAFCITRLKLSSAGVTQLNRSGVDSVTGVVSLSSPPLPPLQKICK